MKRIAAGCLAFVALSAAALDVVVRKPGGWVDLKREGALERLEAEHPIRYARVAQVLRAAEHPSCENRAVRVMKVRHELNDMYCGFTILTSFPAKRDVSFVLDDVGYIARVTLAADGGVMKAFESR